jgi:hypothetical protein
MKNNKITKYAQCKWKPLLANPCKTWWNHGNNAKQFTFPPGLTKWWDSTWILWALIHKTKSLTGSNNNLCQFRPRNQPFSFCSEQFRNFTTYAQRYHLTGAHAGRYTSDSVNTIFVPHQVPLGGGGGGVGGTPWKTGGGRVLRLGPQPGCGRSNSLSLR